jgi:predicted patatin/cPLA2 family phospholipase
MKKMKNKRKKDFLEEIYGNLLDSISDDYPELEKRMGDIEVDGKTYLLLPMELKNKFVERIVKTLKEVYEKGKKDGKKIKEKVQTD